MTLVIGSTGFIGSHFLKWLPHAIGVSRKGPFPFDLANPFLDNLPFQDCHSALITAAISRPPLCEDNPQISFQINVTGTLKLCEALLERGIFPILFSSDYVFDGALDEYHENSARNPLNHYGAQKAELEERALQLDCLIIRLSKVYSTEKGEKTLLDEMAFNLSQKREIKAAHDQIVAPIHIKDVVTAVSLLQLQKCRGLFNLAGEEKISRYELACQLATKMRTPDLVRKIALSDLKEGFVRPKSTVLNIKKLKNQIPLSFISLEESVESMARQYDNH